MIDILYTRKSDIASLEGQHAFAKTMKLAMLRLACTLLVFIAGSAHALEVKWTKISDPIGVHQQACMASNPVTGDVYLFDAGGFYQWSGNDWISIVGGSLQPVGRSGCAATWDSGKGEFQLYGGGTPPLGDFWTWNPVNGWSQRTDSVQRKNHAMVYDQSRGVTVAFGGVNNAGALLTALFEWNGQSNSWSPGGAMAATARERTALTQPLNSSNIYLVGSGTTWLRGESGWSNSLPTLSLNGMAAVSFRDQSLGDVVVSFGGRSGTATDDVWLLVNGVWQKHPKGADPQWPLPRFYHSMAAVKAPGRWLMFGGESTTVFNDAWEGELMGFVSYVPPDGGTPRDGGPTAGNTAGTTGRELPKSPFGCGCTSSGPSTLLTALFFLFRRSRSKF